MSEKNIRIVDYSPVYKKAFKDLNEEWIRQYFKMEEADYKSLDHPEENIINKGGYIKIALLNDEPVGVCALMTCEHPVYQFELAKMAVSPKAHGMGIGSQLGQAIIEQAKESGAEKIFLESNTILTPAINLYKKLGFVKVEGYKSPYERSNIQMELIVK